MRLNEIEDNNYEERSDKAFKILTKYFRHTGDFSVDEDNGSISIYDGSCTLKLNIDKLPLSFDEVDEKFICRGKGLETLIGSPVIVQIFDCSNNKITTLEGFPKKVANANCIRNPLAKLHAISCEVSDILQLTYTDELPLLGLLTFKKINYIQLHGLNASNNNIINSILRKYIGKYNRGTTLQCAVELTRAGYKGNARL